MQESNEKKCCGTCLWHDQWSYVCFNGSSENRGDYTDNFDSCPEWQEDKCELEVDLISREAVLCEINQITGEGWESGYAAKRCYDIVANAPAVNASPWISVNDRWPKPHEKVIVCFRGDVDVAWVGAASKIFYKNGKPIKVSHWMKMPEPPKEKA